MLQEGLSLPNRVVAPHHHPNPGPRQGVQGQNTEQKDLLPKASRHASNGPVVKTYTICRQTL